LTFGEILTIPYLGSIEQALEPGPRPYIHVLALEALGVLLATAHWTWWQTLFAAGIGALGAVTLMQMQREVTEEAERVALEDREELLVGVAHDLRTPIAAMQACFAALRTGVTPQLIEAISAELKSMELIVQDFLRSGSAERGGEVCDLSEVVEQCRRALPPDVAGRVSSCTEGEIRVRLPARDAYRAAQNLISNALKYSRGSVSVSVNRSGSTAVLMVADRGEGIPQEDIARLFTRYARGSKTAPGGFGLGLAVVKEIAEQAGGALRYRREASGSSVFEFEVPAAGQKR
jgi:signal transduction histidine kinase